MSENSLLKNNVFGRVANAGSAGTGTTNSTGVDTKDAHSVLFQILFGAIVTGAVVTVKLQESDDNSTFTDVTSADSNASFAVADDQDNKVAMIEFFRPQKRYVRVSVVVATQNATIDGILYVLSCGLRTLPTSQPASIVSTGNKVCISAQ